MVKIKGYSNYFFCPRAVAIFHRKDGSLVELRPTRRVKREKCYVLHENGMPYTVRLFDVIRDNFAEILLFLGKTFKSEREH